MDKLFREMKTQGIEAKSGKVGEPSDLVKQGDDLYVVVPFELTMSYEDGRIISKGYVIGVSSDQGKAWTFVNSNTSDNIKKILPNIPSDLKLPEVKKPVFEKD